MDSDYGVDSDDLDFGSPASSQQDEWLSEEEEEHDDGGLMSEHAMMSAATNQQPAWRVMDRRALESMQANALEAVVSILGCSRSAARLMLMHFRWDRDLLFGALAERGQDFICHLARVAPVSSEPPAQLRTADAVVSCGVCFCNVRTCDATPMECGHTFCNDCWRQHCSVQISEGNCRLLCCMAVGCRAICNEDQIKQLISDEPALLDRYSNSLLESFVDDNKHVKWCPSAPHCGRAVQVDGEPQCEPMCDCGKQFCFACLQEPHSPCSCDIWRRWVEKTSGESENNTWVTANTKPCPKCHSAVEKSSGCNHVTCRCGQHFCWLCGGATGLSHTWTSIAQHTCGKYREEVDQRIEVAARNLKRYHHYLGRWEAHVASQKLEDEHTAMVSAKIAELESIDPVPGAAAANLKDFTWLTQALQQLFLARRILGYSYVACFWMFDGETFADDIPKEQLDSLKELFEDAMAMLESEVERLSALTDRPTEDLASGSTGSGACNSSNGLAAGGSSNEASGNLRLAIINSTVNIDRRLAGLYDLLENDILATVNSSVHSIAPYKGQSTLRNTHDATAMGPGGLSVLAGQKSDFGPPSPVQKVPRPTVVDLTGDD